MSTWDEVGAALEELATIRGGPHKLYKPVVRVEYYEHDEVVTVEVGRCKGMEEVVIRKSVTSAQESVDDCLLVALKAAIAEAKG